MSNTTKRPHAHVKRIADALIERFAPDCERIEVAGSLRRLQPEVGDIELVVIPRFEADDLFGMNKGTSLLDAHLDSLLAQGKIAHTESKRWGDKLKSFTFTTNSDNTYQVDVFIQTPETWGVNYMIRTGSAAFTKRMVTQRTKGGLCPNDIYFKEARLWQRGELLDTPEEADVFSALGVEYVQPELRE